VDREKHKKSSGTPLDHRTDEDDTQASPRCCAYVEPLREFNLGRISTSLAAKQIVVGLGVVTI